MVSSSPERLTAIPDRVLSPAQRTAVSIGLFVGIAALSVALPEQHLAYAEIVPLLLFARAQGLVASITAALIIAPLLDALQHRRDIAEWPLFQLETVLLFSVFVTVLVIVDRYEDILVRSHRREAERLSNLPETVRREEAAAHDRDLTAIAESIPQLVWRSRGDGKFEYFNAAWRLYSGIEPSTLEDDQGFQRVIHPEDMEVVVERWKNAYRSGTVYETEVRLRAADGTYRWFLGRATPLRDRSGKIVRWFGTCTDIDDQKRAQQRLERRFELANRVSEAFQDASLPLALPEIPGVHFSALYRAGKREAAVGGDWYDAVRLVDGRIVVSIGDVAGSGLGAAITMVAMRQAIRGAAQVHADPVLILDAADRTLRQDTPDRMVTAFVGVYDPITRSLTYASAGHPPPLMRAPDGSISELCAPGLPLGVRRKGDTEARRTTLATGAVVVLYTDGLIEATHDLIAGQERLRAAVAQLEPRAKRLAERIARAVVDGPARDDVAILTLETEEVRENSRYRSWSFDSLDQAGARVVRDAFAAMLVEGGANNNVLEDAELVLSELLGNVVRHARGTCEIVLDLTGALPVVSVLDRGRGVPADGELLADAYAESGRGLFIVRALAADFNATERPGGGTHARAVLNVDPLATPVCVQRAAVA